MWGTSAWNSAPWNGQANVLVPPVGADTRTITALWADVQQLAACWVDRCTRIVDWMDRKTMAAPNLNSKIAGVVIGDDKPVVRTYKLTVPADTAITKAWVTVKRRENDADGSALLQFTITTSVTANGQITDANTVGGSIGLTFWLARTFTKTLKVGAVYYYDVQLETFEGKLLTVEKGTFTPIQQLTRSES